MQVKQWYWDRGVGAWIFADSLEIERFYAEPGNISVGEILPVGAEPPVGEPRSE